MLFNSQINLWFAKVPTLEAANFPWQDLDDLPSKPPTPLMRLAFKEGRVYQSGELQTKRSSKSERYSQSKQKAKGRRRSHSIAIPLTWELRLHQVVQSANSKSPQIVIDDIIDSVSDFTKSESPSDDITILAIQRIDS